MVQILGVTIRLYGLMIALGIGSGAWVAGKVAKMKGLSEEVIWGGLVWVVVAGVVGARAYHVVDMWEYYSRHVIEVVALWHGGLGIFGALAGGTAGLIVYVYRAYETNRISYLRKILDAVAVGIPLGQAIGRWGNFLNQELYGKPTNLPWGVYIDQAHRARGWEQYSRFQPLFLYESLLSLLLFGVMMRMVGHMKWKMGSGKWLGTYLVGYGLIRLVLEAMRIEKWAVLGMPVAQWVSIIMIGTGILLLGRSRFQIAKSK